MIPRMSAKEFDLFLAFIKNCENYVEFGAGGSTFVASQYVKRSILSLDSSTEWLDLVQKACAPNPTAPTTIYVNIGTIGQWGYPTDLNTKHLWPRYCENMWAHDDAKRGDLYMIDGRFRVASFASTILNCNKNAIIMFHDFSSRKEYHLIREIAREIATSEDMSAFVPRANVETIANNIFENYKFSAA